MLHKTSNRSVKRASVPAKRGAPPPRTKGSVAKKAVPARKATKAAVVGRKASSTHVPAKSSALAKKLVGKIAKIAAPARPSRAKATSPKKNVPKVAPARKVPAKPSGPKAVSNKALKKKAVVTKAAPAKIPAQKVVVPKAPAKKTPAVRQVAKHPEGYSNDERFINHQRAVLEAERATYMEQAKNLKEEAEALVEEMEPGDIQFDEESGEGGTVTVARERDLALSAQALAAAEEIDDALAKIKAGHYGACEGCGGLIPKARLEALPYARLCIACKNGGLSRR